MLVKILKSFPYSRNGVDAVQAVEGTEADIPDPYIDGLLRERFVAHVEAAPANKMVNPIEETGQTVQFEQNAQTDIPAGWRTLSWPKLRALASSLSDGPVRNKDDAIAAVEAAQNR